MAAEIDKNLEQAENDLFVRYSEEINEAYRRAVRGALKKHKQAGKMVILQPEDIEVD